MAPKANKGGKQAKEPEKAGGSKVKGGKIAHGGVMLDFAYGT